MSAKVVVLAKTKSTISVSITWTVWAEPDNDNAVKLDASLISTVWKSPERVNDSKLVLALAVTVA